MYGSHDSTLDNNERLTTTHASSGSNCIQLSRNKNGFARLFPPNACTLDPLLSCPTYYGTYWLRRGYPDNGDLEAFLDRQNDIQKRRARGGLI